jgi:hypothetical protein
MARQPTKDAPAGTEAEEQSSVPVCGIAMPISGDGSYSDEHWRRVQRILVKAVERAEMTPRLIWENPEVDVIVSRILQNIYECDVLVCDVSGLNPNVMLELGLRLSTKRPTIVVTDGAMKPPFDISVYQYHAYQRDLEYNSLDVFINNLAGKIKQVYSAFQDGKYKSFVENFTFEVVEPSEVTIPAEEAMRERLDGLSSQLKRLETRLLQVPTPVIRQAPPIYQDIDISLGGAQLDELVDEIKNRKYVQSVTSKPRKPYGQTLTIGTSSRLSENEHDQLFKWIKLTIDRIDEIPF